MASHFANIKGLEPVTSYGNPNVELSFMGWCVIGFALIMFIAILGPELIGLFSDGASDDRQTG